MARIKKRTDGRYCKTLTYNGKKYYFYGDTPTEAESKKAKKLEELENGVIEKSNPLLNDYYESFSKFRTNKIRPSTIRCQVYAFRNCADTPINDKGDTLGEMQIADIKSAHIRQLQTALTKTNLSVRSINDYMAHLSTVFKQATDDELIPSNPCRKVSKVPETVKPASETYHRALSVEETKLFFENASESYFINAYKLLIQTGLRIGELSALTPSDIDYKNNCIHIYKTATKNESGLYYISENTKTKAGKRDIPLNDTIIEIVQNQIQLNQDVWGSVRPIDDLLFKSPEGAILKEYQINRDIKRITKRADIQHFTCHAFRATYATRFIEQQPHLYKVLSELLGHTTTDITLNLYTHVMKETKHTAVQNIHIAM